MLVGFCLLACLKKKKEHEEISKKIFSLIVFPYS